MFAAISELSPACIAYLPVLVAATDPRSLADMGHPACSFARVIAHQARFAVARWHMLLSCPRFPAFIANEPMLRRRVLYRRSARMASRLMRQRGKGYGQHQRHQANGGKYFPFSHFFCTPFPAFPCFCLLYHADVTLRSNLHQKKKKNRLQFCFLFVIYKI